MWKNYVFMKLNYLCQSCCNKNNYKYLGLRLPSLSPTHTLPLKIKSPPKATSNLFLHYSIRILYKAVYCMFKLYTSYILRQMIKSKKHSITEFGR